MKIQNHNFPNYPRLHRQLKEAQSELSLFDLKDQVAAQSGARSSTTYGMKVPALGLLSGTLGGAALALIPSLAPWSLLAGPGLGLGLGLAWESTQQSKLSVQHQAQREEILLKIEDLKFQLGW